MRVVHNATGIYDDLADKGFFCKNTKGIVYGCLRDADPIPIDQPEHFLSSQVGPAVQKEPRDIDPLRRGVNPMTPQDVRELTARLVRYHGAYGNTGPGKGAPNERSNA